MLFCDLYIRFRIFVQGELVGGLDIVKELVEAGDLVPTLKGEA